VVGPQVAEFVAGDGAHRQFISISARDAAALVTILEVRRRGCRIRRSKGRARDTAQ
jgi:hypothetical protein